MRLQNPATLSVLRKRNQRVWREYKRELSRFKRRSDLPAFALHSKTEPADLGGDKGSVEAAIATHCETMSRELLSSFAILNASLDFAELRNLGAEFIRAVGQDVSAETFATKVGAYLERVDLVIEASDFSDEIVNKVKATSFDCISVAMAVLSGAAVVSSEGQREAYKDLMHDVAWQEHFRANLPPKYEGVKASGKALPFFLEWYRGKTPELRDHSNGRPDYVALGLRQIDVRHHDNRLMRALENHFAYKKSHQRLVDVLPPATQLTTTIQ